jgi:sugar-specific transcriptional regulator TrmB
MDDEAISSLQAVGFSLYEAKLYLGLLEHGSQNGNELSRASGVPSSKVYATLDRLAAAGIVNQVSDGSSSTYVCVPPEDLVRRLREQYAQPLAYLEAALPALASRTPDLDTMQLSNAATLIDEARIIVDEAREEIFVSLWDESVELLRTNLESAHERGIAVFAMIYGEAEIEGGWWQHHSYRETVAARIGGHMLTLVADGREALIARMPERGEPTGIRTRSPVLCLVVEEYLRHDLILQRAKTMTGYEQWDAWLQSNDDVRALTLGRGGLTSPVDPDARATIDRLSRDRERA